MTSNRPDTQTESARRWAARMLIEPAERFPNLHPPRLDTTALSPADTALGLAIYRNTIQRWLTLEYILDKYLQTRLRKLDAPVQAVLLSGAAQLLFMDRLPGYAVVDQAVGITRGLGLKQSTGLVNAVLRKVAALVDSTERDTPYTPGPTLLPLAGLALPGNEPACRVERGSIRLNQPILPPAEQLEWHLSIAASVPRQLIHTWIERFGQQQATALALQSIENPPTIVAVEPGFAAAEGDADLRPHQRPGFVVWTGPHEAMRQFLLGHPLRRVQDPAASLAVGATLNLSPAAVLDYCAGRGTKTRQLALAHPGATVYATDTDQTRLADLETALADYPNARVIAPDAVGERAYDLILLDVPCSNTGVLARRPEARYRYSQQSLGELVQLQRKIVDQAVQWLDTSGGRGGKPSACLLYSTCSVEHAENRKQVDRLIRKSPPEVTATLINEHLQLPAGTGDSYADGSYHALVELTG